MPKFPDILLNNNPDAPSVDLNDLQVKGVGIFADATERDALNSNLHTEGYLAIMKDTDTPFIYTGGTWTDSASWSEVKGLWDEDANGINYQAGNVGIGTTSSATHSLIVDDKLRVEYNNFTYYTIESQSGIKIEDSDLLFSNVNTGIRITAAAGQTKGIAIGNSASATVSGDAVSVGKSVKSGDSGSVSIGTNVAENSSPTGRNVFIGKNIASNNLTTGTGNIAIESNALYNLSTGNYNIAIGTESGSSITTESYNTFIGHQAGRTNDGSYNTFIGFEAGEQSNLNNSVAIGLSSNKTAGAFTNAVAIGTSNALGNNAIMIGSGTATGNEAIAIGGSCNVNSQRSIGIGYESATGASSIVIGNRTNRYTATSSTNILIGHGDRAHFGNGNVNVGNSFIINITDVNTGGIAPYGNVTLGHSNCNYSPGNTHNNLIVGGSNFSTSGIGTEVAWNTIMSTSLNGTGSPLRNTIIGIRNTHVNQAVLGNDNVFIGYNSGFSEAGSDKLYIANSSTTTPLIYGDFSTSTLRANGTFEIGDPASTGYAFPTATGTLDQVLKVDANGDLVFGDDLNGLWTADTNGITYTAGNVGIGTASSATRKLVVTGGVRLETFMEMDANNDGNGNIVIGTSSNYSALTSNNCIVIGNNNTIGASNPTQTIVIGRNKDVSSRSYRCTDIGGSGGSTYIDGSGTTSNQVAISADAGSHGAVIVIDGQVNSDYAIAIGGRAGAESVTVGNSSYASHYANYSAVVGRQIARFHTGGDSNVLVGYRVAYGTSGSSVSSSVLIGAQVANSSTTNINNVMVGYRAGYNTTTGSSNVFLGYQAGYSETTSNKLYIANSSTTSPLIYGEFDNDLCRVNGNLQRVIYGSTETTTSGTIHIRDNTDWATQADATDNTASTGLLGIALGSAANAGLVLFGDVDYTITGNVGIPVYLDTTAGGLTTTAPTGSGNIVRVMGYIIGTNKVFFNPSNDWLEIV